MDEHRAVLVGKKLPWLRLMLGQVVGQTGRVDQPVTDSLCSVLNLTTQIEYKLRAGDVR